MFHVADQVSKRAPDSGFAPDENIVAVGSSQKRYNLCCRRAQPSLGAIAHHGIAQFTRGGESDTDHGGGGFIFSAQARLNYQRGFNTLKTALRGRKKVDAALELAYGYV